MGKNGGKVIGLVIGAGLLLLAPEVLEAIVSVIGVAAAA